MKRALRTLTPTVALATVLTTTACGSPSDAGHGGNGGHPPVSSPTTTAATRPGSDGHNEADVAFATGMIPHHTQAIDMADLAMAQASSSDVKALATQIKAAQDPEIQTMTAWLKAWGAPVPGAADAGSHDMEGHGSTSGMMTADEMKALAAATGSAFDRMWLDMMIRHHEGAVTMSRSQLARGSHADTKQLAQAIIEGQTKEITMMKGLLGSGS